MANESTPAAPGTPGHWSKHVRPAWGVAALLPAAVSGRLRVSHDEGDSAELLDWQTAGSTLSPASSPPAGLAVPPVGSPGEHGGDVDADDLSDHDEIGYGSLDGAEPLLLDHGDGDDGSGAGSSTGSGGGGAVHFVREVYRLVRYNGEYRLLWLSDIVNGLGDWFNYLAVITLVTELSGSSSLAVAGLMLTRTLPPTLLTPLIGWTADRFDRLLVMVASNVLVALSVLLYLAVGASLPFLYTVSVLQFALGAFYDPAQAGTTPQLVPRAQLMVANALDTTTWSLMLAIGSFLGGIALHYLGATLCFLVDAASYVVSTLCLLRLWFRLRAKRRHTEAMDVEEQAAKPGDGAAASDGSPHENVRLADGARFLWRNPVVFFMCFTGASDSVSWGAMDVINIAFVERVYAAAGDGTESSSAILLGLYYLVVAFGTAAGPICVRLIPQSLVHPERFSGLVMLVQLSYVLVVAGAGTQALVPSLLALFFLGNAIRTAGNAINYVAVKGFLQTAVPELYRGRIFAFESGVNMAAMTSAQLLAGAMIDRWGFAPGDAVRAVALVAFGILVFWVAHFWIARRRYEALYARQALVDARDAAAAKAAGAGEAPSPGQYLY